MAFKSYLKHQFPQFYSFLANAHKHSPFFSREKYRKPIVELVKQELLTHTNFNLLEIGVKQGESLFLWGQFCKDAERGNVLGIDLWDDDEDYQLFLKNLPKNDHIHYRKGDADDILPTLSPKSYDLVFVDGGHSYSQTKKDILHSIPLIKDGGVLCGDDLELLASEVDRQVMVEEKERETGYDPKTRRNYHPGVSLAIEEIFGNKVTHERVFWAFRRRGDAWANILGGSDGPSKTKA